LQDIQQLVSDCLLERVEIVDLLACDAATDCFKNRERCRHADVGGDQDLFELVQKLFVDLLAAGKNSVEFF
jgi:hypothetical protein